MGLITLFTSLTTRRNNIWDPPTLLDSILDSPVQYFISHVYIFFLVLRGPLPRFFPFSLLHHLFPWFASPAGPSPYSLGKVPIRIVCISDTHDQTVPLPKGDLLIHAGDLTNDGSVASIQAQLDWLSVQPHRHKIAICGNHDSWFDVNSRRVEDKESGARPDLKGIIYLERSSVELEFDGGRKLKVYGAPDIPKCGGSDFAFQYVRHLPPWERTVPMDTDILVTHAPPKYHRDLGLGCFGILQEIWRVKPKVHIFGHIHWGKGTEVAYFDKCQSAYESLMARPKKGAIYDVTDTDRWIDALSVLFYGAYYVCARWTPILPWTGIPREACRLVNAAQMHGNSGKMGSVVEVVEI